MCLYVHNECVRYTLTDLAFTSPPISILIRIFLLHHHYNSSSSFLILIIHVSFFLSPFLTLSPTLHQHYNHFMYQALLHCAKNSMNSLKKRIGSKSITVNPHRSLRKQAMVRTPARTRTCTCSCISTYAFLFIYNTMTSGFNFLLAQCRTS